MLEIVLVILVVLLGTAVYGYAQARGELIELQEAVHEVQRRTGFINKLDDESDSRSVLDIATLQAESRKKSHGRES